VAPPAAVEPVASVEAVTAEAEAALASLLEAWVVSSVQWRAYSAPSWEVPCLVPFGLATRIGAASEDVVVAAVADVVVVAAVADVVVVAAVAAVAAAAAAVIPAQARSRLGRPPLCLAGIAAMRACSFSDACHRYQTSAQPSAFSI